MPQHHKEIKPKKFEVGLSYFENVNIPERFSLDYLSDFIGQVQKFKSLKSSKDVKRSYLETKVSMFTKYPYLYNSLRKHNKLCIQLLLIMINILYLLELVDFF